MLDLRLGGTALLAAGVVVVTSANRRSEGADAVCRLENEAGGTFGMLPAGIDRRAIVSDWGEKRIIREIIGPICNSPAIEIEVGDDAAVLNFPAGQQIVISCDKIPEDLLALQLGLMDPFSHGRYLATVNLSDIAAMGGQPLGLLCTLAIPDTFELEYLRAFVEGFAAGGAEWSTPVVGGDTGWASSVCFGIGLDLELLGTVQGASDAPPAVDLYKFGKVTEGDAGVWLQKGSVLQELTVPGWQHFKGSAMEMVRSIYASGV